MIINPAAYDAYAPALPDNLICKGRATSTANPDHLLHQLLFSHLGLHGYRIISHLEVIPDDRQCVRHLSGMLLLYNLLHVCRPGRRSFIMMPCSLTPLSPIRVEPHNGVYQQSSQHLSDI